MWATAEQYRYYIVNAPARLCAHSDAAIAEPPLESPATVSRWPEERRENVGTE
jgi:hypothetical protein